MIDKVQARISGLKQEVLAGNISGIITRNADLLLVVAVASMVGMMIVPLPTWLLDIFLTINITTALTILMVSIYISDATQIASYPTLLLITTLYRLALDISATRLILLQANAGEVIDAFGKFVVQGNFVVGAVIFLIITLVQFIVITKGSERVAEVAARFTLDAMPGKQMSIDADMRSGIITFEQARARRAGLSRESQFYGAMDGAMKFVKGDAIAGIIITLINIAGGLIIGVAMHGMSVMDAVQVYSILTIGNGLVSQIPALLISILGGYGCYACRLGIERFESRERGRDSSPGTTEGDRGGFVAAADHGDRAWNACYPVSALSGLTGGVAYFLFKAVRKNKEAAADQAVGLDHAPDVSVTLPVLLATGPDLAPAIDLNGERGKSFHALLREVRHSLYYDLGVILPPVQVNGAVSMPPGMYQIWLNETPVASGLVRSNALLVDQSAAKIAIYGISGEESTNPATGKPACWISLDQRPRAETAGLTIWETHEVLIMHVTAFLRRNAREFIGLQEVQFMIDRVKEFYPALVNEVVPKPVSLQALADILQRLVEEGVSIRDLKTILQSLSDSARHESDVAALTERVRAGLRRRICYQLSEGKPLLYLYQLDPEIEEMFRNSIRQSASGPYLAMEPDSIQQVTASAHALFGNLAGTAQNP